jgi:hypothetical protein
MIRGLRSKMVKTELKPLWPDPTGIPFGNRRNPSILYGGGRDPLMTDSPIDIHMSTHRLGPGTPNDKSFALLVTFLFMAVGSVLVYHHEMWRDELHAWQVARDSRDLAELFGAYRYEVHPLLWPLILRGLSRIHSGPEAMQWLNLLISVCSVGVLCMFAPFGRLQKLLLSFGYFMLFEYTVIARNYGLGVLLIFVFCALFPYRERRMPQIAAVLFLLAHSSLMGLIVSAAISIALFVDLFMLRGGPDRDGSTRRTRSLQLSFGIMALGIVSSMLFHSPPEFTRFVDKTDAGYFSGRQFKVFHALIGAYLPLPDFKYGFWNTLWVERSDFAVLLSVLFILSLLLLFVVRNLDRPAPIIILLGSSSVMLFLVYLKYGYMRHFGFNFVACVAALWVEPHSGRLKSRRSFAAVRDRAKLIFGGMFLFVLLVHVAAGIYASVMDFRHPFSMSKATASYLGRSEFEGKTFVGMMDTKASSVICYLPGAVAFYPNARRFGTYIRMDSTRKPYRKEKAMENILSDLGERKEDLVLIFSKPLGEHEREKYGLRKIQDFTGSMVDFEDFILYRFEQGVETKDAR